VTASSAVPSEAVSGSVTVIIPTYNRAHLIGRALESVSQQTLAPGEVIVVDDGSEDTTRDIIREEYPGVTCLHQANRGVSAARNAGIRAACGQFIAFLDSDDAWMPEKLSEQVQALRQSGLQVCHTDEKWMRDGSELKQLDKHTRNGGWIYAKCLPLCAMSPSSVMLDRGVFSEVGMFDESLPACEDYDMWLRVCARYEVSLVAAPLVTKYGGHADQLSRKHWGMDRFRVLSLEKMLVHGQLESLEYRQTLEMLLNKLQILMNGARSRGNSELLSGCIKKIERWERVNAG
jgi:glycosyltransferase involved in cell wall biosynthesis